MDTFEQISLWLADKSYYDYDASREGIDYMKANRRHDTEIVKETAKRMGFGNIKTIKDLKE